MAKFRMGFVSNSSSSSFICDICGGVETGYDASPSDFEMFQCENGHTFHDSCSQIDVDEPTFEIKKQRVKNYYEKQIEYWSKHSSSKKDEYIQEEKENIIQLETIDEDDLEDIYSDIVCDCGISSEFCPICQMKIVTKDDSIKYLFKKLGIDEKGLAKEVKEKFKSYDDLVNFIKA